MSKANPDHLFELIKSLGKAEKRYFKIHTRRHITDNNYIKLFDAIGSQRTYNEEKLKQQKAFPYFRTLKSRLYKEVLRSLEGFHSTTGIEIKSVLVQVEILLNKSLYSQCLKQIKKAKNIAKDYELFELWLEALRWEGIIGIKTYNPGLRDKVLKEETYVLNLLNNQKRYRDLAHRVDIQHLEAGNERSSKKNKKTNELMDSELIRNETKLLSIRARQSFYICHIHASLLKGDLKKTYLYGKQITDMFHENPQMIYINPINYMISINNFLSACEDLKQYHDVPEYVSKLEEVRKNLKSKSDRAIAFFYLYHHLNYYMNLGLFQEAAHILKQIEKELPEHEEKLQPLQKTILYAIIAQVYFGQENYKRSLWWMNRIMYQGEIKVRKDIECFSRIFLLILHYEMKQDNEFMVSLFKSAYRFLSKNKSLYKFETIVMNFIGHDLLKPNRRSKIKQQFIKLKSKLENLSKDQYESPAFKYFDYIAWLESKIERKSFAEIVRRKAK